ncbi:MAG TPA: TIGR00159 family protein [Clostridiaceae bacterium]|nr:TIGR00159 family protein [Clostridiaceae bacterium]
MFNALGQLDQLVTFFKNLFNSLQEGILFVGEPLDIALAVIDILITTFIFYYILRIVRDSRAWQLLKGILFIIFLTIIARVFGLSLLSYLLMNTISVFSLAFVIIFQPELRRTLETVGRSGLNLFNPRSGEYQGERAATTVSQMIESIVQACGEMAESYTGALIVIERTTPLGELQDQENAVEIDSPVSTSLIKQIFVDSTPLHDGAILIRYGRIAAARIHIPLSDNYHLRKDYGTRHRAAIGASEMGDAIAIVLSEEKGTISIAIEGRLYVLENSDALRTQLHRFLLQDEEETEGHFRLFRRKKKNKTMFGPRIPKTRRVLLLFVSLISAFALWFYVQATVNPIEAKSFSVPLSFENTEVPSEKGFEVTYPTKNIQISLTGRKNLLDSMTNRDLEAYLDLAQIEEEGIQTIKINISKNTPLYTRTNYITPDEITIAVRKIEK